MSTKTFITLSLCLIFASFSKAQGPLETGELIVYLTNPMTPAQFAVFADSWNSDVTIPPQPGGQIGVMQARYYPFPDPNDPSISIVNINHHKKRVPDDPEGDGGAKNIYNNPSWPGYKGINCAGDYSLTAEYDSKPVELAIIDTGVEYEGLNGVGYTFNNVEEMLTTDGDDNGHGTHIASTIHNTYLNSPNASLNLISYNIGGALTTDGTGTIADVIMHVEQAILLGSQIINCSFSFFQEFNTQGGGVGGNSNGNAGGGGSGGSTDDPPSVGKFDPEHPLYLLMASVNPQDVLFVCSAGNDEVDLDAQTVGNYYPAAFDLENIITVASHNCSEAISSFSNYGLESVDIASYGEDVKAYNNLIQEEEMSGTSQAAALVSGGAVVLASHLETFNSLDIKCAILEGARQSAALSTKVLCGGYYELDKAITVLINGCGVGSPFEGRSLVKEGAESVKISPNPFIDNTNISFNLTHHGAIQYTVFTTSGQIVNRGSVQGVIGENTLSLNFDQTNTGAYYLVRIETEEFSQVVKLIQF